MHDAHLAVAHRGHAFRALCIALVALCIAIPATYDSFLANRLRYLWPFTAAWMIGLAAIGDAAAVLALRFDEKLSTLRMIVAGILIAVMGGQLAESVEGLGVSTPASPNTVDTDDFSKYVEVEPDPAQDDEQGGRARRKRACLLTIMLRSAYFFFVSLSTMCSLAYRTPLPL